MWISPTNYENKFLLHFSQVQDKVCLINQTPTQDESSPYKFDYFLTKK